eukprot:TRINITY_DN4419_c0_g2_i2.p1 TRINITY_DN4419_c0_g2~~TRINITY_DN4419_c0_g2_i2.p1  ORF type:complete len:376 (+),score=43.52 TRINITY_DN4419_c0_g2_i2:144-1271(+)
MKRCRVLMKKKAAESRNSYFVGERKVQPGLQSGRMRDEVPGLDNRSGEAKTMRLLGQMEKRKYQIDERHGWGDRGSVYDHRRLSDIPENNASDAWRVHYGQDIANYVGEEGINKWKADNQALLNQAALKATNPNKKIFERDDLPPWMDWNVPPKRIRLENTLNHMEPTIHKTPDYDLSRYQTDILERVFRGLEVAFTHNPLPVLNFKENMCVTHCECTNWGARDFWFIMWKLVLDDSPRRVEEYKRALQGGVLSVWGKVLANYEITQYKMPIVLRFVYDNGTIPYKQGIVDINAELAARGLAPKTVVGPTDHLQQSPFAHKAPTEHHSEINHFLEETRKRFKTSFSTHKQNLQRKLQHQQYAREANTLPLSEQII